MKVPGNIRGKGANVESLFVSANANSFSTGPD